MLFEMKGFAGKLIPDEEDDYSEEKYTEEEYSEIESEHLQKQKPEVPAESSGYNQDSFHEEPIEDEIDKEYVGEIVDDVDEEEEVKKTIPQLN